MCLKCCIGLKPVSPLWLTWWDACDYISSSGYYPIDSWDRELDRIQKVVEKFDRPFFFAECGCMASTGSSKIPNDWELAGEVNLPEQASHHVTLSS